MEGGGEGYVSSRRSVSSRSKAKEENANGAITIGLVHLCLIWKRTSCCLDDFSVCATANPTTLAVTDSTLRSEVNGGVFLLVVRNDPEEGEEEKGDAFALDIAFSAPASFSERSSGVLAPFFVCSLDVFMRNRRRSACERFDVAVIIVEDVKDEDNRPTEAASLSFLVCRLVSTQRPVPVRTLPSRTKKLQHAMMSSTICPTRGRERDVVEKKERYSQ